MADVNETNGIPSEVTLFPCPLCGGEVTVARIENELEERYWLVTRGLDKATRCNCRLFLESPKFLDSWDSAHALECRRKLVERWNTRSAFYGMATLAADLQAVRTYSERVRDLLVRAYGLASSVWGAVPAEYLSVDYCDRMNALYNDMHELGIEVEQ